jgi:hypothetical protein
LAHVDQDERDSFVARRIGVGASQGENMVGKMACRCPNFLTIENPLITVEFALLADVAEV